MSLISTVLKVHKHEIILIFYFTEIKSLFFWPFVNFRKNFSSFPSIFARISMFEHFRGTKIFLRDIQKNFHFGPIRWFLDSFSKFGFFKGEICILIMDFWVIFKNYSMRMLSIRWNDFIACWAYEEPISSHAEHTRNEFPRMLSQQ